MQVLSNPFNKPNPFQYAPASLNRFQHPHYNNKKQTVNTPHIYKQQHAPQLNNFFQNNWSFHNDNLAKKTTFKKTDFEQTDASRFSIVLKTNNLRNSYMKYPDFPQQKNKKGQDNLKLQNPFFRKNLFVNRQEVVQQLAMDISLYRNKTTSNYEVNASSHYTYDQSPVMIREKVVSFNENGNRSRKNSERHQELQIEYKVRQSEENSLKYSRTPQLTERSKKERQKQKQTNLEDPQTLSVKGKIFYLAALN